MEILFTKHALDRIRTREIDKLDIEESIKYPDNIYKKYGKYYFRKLLERGTIEVCCE
jgi:hypothetical protein